MSAPDVERPRIPLGATPLWLAAVESAGWQCQCTTGPEPVPVCGHSHRSQPQGRCKRRADGFTPVRLILTADGAVYCDQCAEGRERAARRRARTAPPTTSSGFEQGDLLGALL